MTIGKNAYTEYAVNYHTYIDIDKFFFQHKYGAHSYVKTAMRVMYKPFLIPVEARKPNL